MLKNLSRRGFIRLSLGAAVLPVMASLPATKSAFASVEVVFLGNKIPSVVAFELTREQALGTDPCDEFVLTANQTCTVTGLELVLHEHPETGEKIDLRFNLIKSMGNKVWNMYAYDTLTIGRPSGAWLTIVD